MPTAFLTRARLEQILEKLPSLRVGVIGDFALDGYWHVEMTQAEISRETPLYNRPVSAEKYSPGGAANVAWNLADLKLGRVTAITVFGEDWRGEILRGIFARLGILQDGILTQANWFTPFYGKVILHGLQSQQEDARIDFLNPAPPSQETQQKLVDTVRGLLPGLDALVVVDMMPGGVVTAEVAQSLNALAEANPRVVFAADSRRNISRFRNMLIKPNEVEAEQLLGPGQNPDNLSPQELAQAILARGSTRPAYVTLGERGCLLCAAPEAALIPAIPVPPPLDTVGAGDTFVANVTAALAAGATPTEAGFFANLAAAVTIRKLRLTGTASPDEILACFDASQST